MREAAADLLGDVLADFVYGLAAGMCGAFDAGAAFGPVGLEAVVRGWLDYGASRAAAQRAFLLCLCRAE